MLDAYMTASLFFFGLSVILCVASVVLDIGDVSTRVNMAQIEIAQASNDTEKIAIFLDIFRLIILVVALKSKEDQIVRRIKICRGLFFFWILIFMGIMAYRYFELYDDIKSEDFGEALSLWYAIIYTYLYNFTMIIAYGYLYITLKRTYSQVKVTFAKDLSAKEIRQIDENLCSLLILQISIIQMCVYRLTFETYNIFHDDKEAYNNRYLYLCKGILVLGICISIYLRLRSSGVNSDQLGENGTSFIQLGESLLGKAEEDPRNKNFKQENTLLEDDNDIKLPGEEESDEGNGGYQGRDMCSLLPGAIERMGIFFGGSILE